MLRQTCEKKEERYVGTNGATWQNGLLLTLSELYPNAAGREGVWRNSWFYFKDAELVMRRERKYNPCCRILQSCSFLVGNYKGERARLFLGSA